MTTPTHPTPASGPQPAFKPWYVAQGDRIDKYTVWTAIGMGSGAVVYDVIDSDGMHFALKLLCSPLAASGRNPVPVGRLYGSVAAHVAALELPTVPKFIGAGFLRKPEGAFPYLVMELVRHGEPITEWAARTSPTFAKVVKVFNEIATALGVLAEKGICHRDLKPENILIAPGDMPKVIDLNSAFVPTQNRITASAASAIPGTPAYFSPELAAAVLEELESGKRARYAYAPTDDLYSLGCVLYEVLTGAIPCCDDLSASAVTILRQITSVQPLRPEQLNPSVPWALNKIVMKLLNKNPAKRYRSGFALSDDLAAALGTEDERWEQPLQVRLRETKLALPWWVDPSMENELAESSTELPAAERPRRRWATGIGITAMAVVALVTGLLVRQDCSPEPAAGKGPTVLCKAKMAVVGIATLALSCVELTKNVVEQDRAWLAECPAEARGAVKSLGIEYASFDTLHEGPTVKRTQYGYELKAGPIELRPSNLDWLGGGTLYGDIRIHSDGATLRFTKLKLDHEDRVRPICAIAFPQGDPIGFRKIPKDNPNRVPDSELHPNEGFIYVVGGWVVTKFAQ